MAAMEVGVHSTLGGIEQTDGLTEIVVDSAIEARADIQIGRNSSGAEMNDCVATE